MRLKLDTPVEVSKIQYNKIMIDNAGSCSGRIDESTNDPKNWRYYIKLWHPAWRPEIEKIVFGK